MGALDHVVRRLPRRPPAQAWCSSRRRHFCKSQKQDLRPFVAGRRARVGRKSWFPGSRLCRSTSLSLLYAGKDRSTSERVLFRCPVQPLHSSTGLSTRNALRAAGSASGGLVDPRTHHSWFINTRRRIGTSTPGVPVNFTIQYATYRIRSSILYIDNMYSTYSERPWITIPHPLTHTARRRLRH